PKTKAKDEPTMDLFEYMRGNQRAANGSKGKGKGTGKGKGKERGECVQEGSMTGAMNCISGRKDASKLFACHVHDTKDMLGACTFVVAQDEARALECINRRLIAKGFQSRDRHQFTVKRLPVYRECFFFIGSMASKKLE